MLTFGEPVGASGAGFLFGEGALTGDGFLGGLGGGTERFLGTGGAVGGAGASLFFGDEAGLEEPPLWADLLGPWYNSYSFLGEDTCLSLASC